MTLWLPVYDGYYEGVGLSGVCFVCFYFGVFVLLGFSFGRLLFVLVLRWVGVCLFGGWVLVGWVVVWVGCWWCLFVLVC